MFKANNINTRTAFSSVSFVGAEQVHVNWVVSQNLIQVQFMFEKS